MSIELYLVRHAIAEQRGPAWPDDSKRPLTDEGIARMRRIVGGLAALDVVLDVIFSSPYVRARQTADLLAEGLSPRPPVVEVPELAPSRRIGDMLAALPVRPRHRSIALVGHEPSMGELAARLLKAHDAVPFKKGAICCLEVTALPSTTPGVLRWFATPRMLRKLGDS
ncbi:MAG: phosphohistidine phosphatase SixA [Vicinamibacteraceae bacterium]